MDAPLPTTYVRVSRPALGRNLAAVRAALAPGVRLCAVVKANAYGHGLVETARLFVEGGADLLGVASLDEALELRRAGLETPILVFHPLTDSELRAAVEQRLIVTLTHPERAERLARVAGGGGLDYQLEIDVGLGRSGCRDDPLTFLERARKTLGHAASGVWAHLGPGMAPVSVPSPPRTWSEAKDVPSRLGHLAALRERLRAEEEAPAFHVAASAALCDCPALQWDMVRVGSLLYGVRPPGVKREPFALESALELRTRIVDVRPAPRGAPVGYGAEFRPAFDTLLAVLPVGLYHGVGVIPESTVSVATGARRWLARWRGARGGVFRPTLVRIGDEHAPIVGRISLNECTVDLGGLRPCPVGTEVAVPVRMTTLNPAIPRVHVDGGP
ncbi:MAG: alanine racemase [Armatimonadetes bacterium]|nr:alanine racemase [Armatimonadota bacterium]